MNLMRMKIIDRKVAQSGLVQLQMLSTASPTNPSPEIKIPPRKERGPTDILRALETTVSRDPTAPDYKYMDDPYFIPFSLAKKRTYSLAKESGKRAAMWVLQEHADLLRSNLSEPLIKAFLPPEEYKEKSQVSEEILQNLIKLGMVSQVLDVYELIGENITNETKQNLLELLCFYNSSEDQISEEFPEERSYQPDQGINKNVWKAHPTLDKLFNDLIQDEGYKARAYNALLSGFAKYMRLDKASELYEECQNKNIPLDVTTYNQMINLTNLFKDKSDDRKLKLQQFLIAMTKDGVKPNVMTLNAALRVISTMLNPSSHRDFALSTVVEFKHIGIKPSLASYYYLLKIFYDPNAAPSNILSEIVDILETEELKMQDPQDLEFFCAAMEVSNEMQDLECGHRIHRLLLQKKNYKFVGGRLKESIYYRNYLQLILNFESIDDFMKTYDLLVPHIYIPEPAVMRDILDMLKLNEREKLLELLPRFLSHLQMFDMLDRHLVMKIALDLMSNSGHPDENSPLHELYANFAETFFNHMKERKERQMQRSMWPSSIFGDMGVILARGNKFDKMLEVVDMMLNDAQSIVGSIESSRLQEMFAACIARGRADGALSLIHYSYENGLDSTITNAKILKEVLPLSGGQETELMNLLGSSAFESFSKTEKPPTSRE